MDGQIYHSTLSDRRFASFHTIVAKSKAKWMVLLASMIFHFVLPGIIYSYGIILVMRIDEGLAAWNVILTPSLFFITWTMADPLFRDAKESWGSNIDVRVLCAIGVILTFSGVVIAAVSTLPLLDPIYLGLFGGLGTSLTLSQIDYVLSDVFETNLGRIKCFCKIGQAFGQCVMPYFILTILDHYGTRIGLLFVSCIIIQILPITYFIKTDRVTQPPKVRKFGSSYVRTYSLFDGKFSDPNLSSSSNNIQLIELSHKTWKSPSVEDISQNLYDEEEGNSTVEEYIITDADMADNRPKNIYGVEILPQITEESETSDSETDEKVFSGYSSSSTTSDRMGYNPNRKRLSEDIKRLSVLSDHLDVIIQSNDNIDEFKDFNENTKNTVGHTSDPEQNIFNTSHNFDWLNYGSNFSKRVQSQVHGCRICSSFKFHQLRRGAQNGFDGFVDFAVDPFLRSIKTWQFYPALLLKICSISIPFIAPCLISLLIRDVLPQRTLNQIAFITTVHGTSWLCVLIALPCALNQMAKSKFKFISTFGMFTASLGMFAVMHSYQIGFIALSTMLIGIGYGLISTTCEDSLRDSVGMRKWVKLRRSIDFVAGVCLGIISSWIGYKLTASNDIQHCFGFLAFLFFFSGLYLIIIPLTVFLRKHQAADQHWPHM